MKPVLVAGPQELAVSLSDAKAHLRVIENDEDDLIVSLVIAVTDYLDGWDGILGRCLVNQNWQFGAAAWLDCIRLPFPDVSSVAITYQDTDGVQQTVASSDYEIVMDSLGAAVWFKDGFSEPDLYRDVREPITVSLTAGYGAPTDIPASIRQAILLMVGHFYENRMAATDARLMEAPMAFKALIEPHRHVVLG